MQKVTGLNSSVFFGEGGIEDLSLRYKELGFFFPYKKHADFQRIHNKTSSGFLSDRMLIISVFNDRRFIEAYSDKNLYDLMVRTKNKPCTLVKCISGCFFDADYRSIEVDELKNTLEVGQSYILKPSRTANGKGIKKVLCKGDGIVASGEVVKYRDLVSEFGADFQIQEIIRQHSAIAEIHPQSVNSLRMVTFRWRGEVRYLLSFLRVGCDGAVNDNAGTGGICVGIEDGGKLKKFAVNKECEVLEKHPTTGYDFSRQPTIPNFKEFVDFVVKLHDDIPHHDLVSWDVAISEDGSPVFIEHNFKGALWLYQMAAGRPLFGEYTDEVVGYLLEQKENPSSRLESSNQYLKYRRDLKASASLLKASKSLIKDKPDLSGVGVLSKKVVVSGKVQGVGYRRWLQKIAKSNKVSGWVRNVAGNVEAVLQGRPENVSCVFILMQQGPRRASVEKLSVEKVKVRAARKTFKVLSDKKSGNP